MGCEVYTNYSLQCSVMDYNLLRVATRYFCTIQEYDQYLYLLHKIIKRSSRLISEPLFATHSTLLTPCGTTYSSDM